MAESVATGEPTAKEYHEEVRTLTTEDIQDMVSHVDPKEKERALKLLIEIKAVEDFKFDNDFHPIVNKKKLSKSNFHDIVNYIIKPTGATPQGYKAFFDFLKKSKIDPELYTRFTTFSPKTPQTPTSVKRSVPGTVPKVLSVYPH